MKELFNKAANLKNDNGVPTYYDMTQRNEQELVKARKDFYDRAITHRVDYLEYAEFAGT